MKYKSRGMHLAKLLRAHQIPYLIIKLIATVSMDSSASDYLATLQNSEYCLAKDDSNLIDLGLSLKTMQSQTYYPSPHENYDVLLDWQNLQSQLKTVNRFNAQDTKRSLNNELEATQSKQRWTYVKVNMDGIMVGRKICIHDHVDYLSLARRLEEMFGKQSMCDLKLFQDESRFSLFYKDGEECWRSVGNVPWKEFVDSVKRLRIVRKEGTTRTWN